MKETDMECGHGKATLHARGVNKSRKIITFSHLNSTNFNDNFKDNFMQEKVKSTLVVLIQWELKFYLRKKTSFHKKF